MNSFRFERVWALAVASALSIAFCGSAAEADITLKVNKDRGTVYQYHLTLTPAGESVPAFKYRFTTPIDKTIPGNSITHYLRSFGEGGLTRPWETAQKEFGMEIYEWSDLEMKEADIDLEQIRKVSGMFDDYVEAHLQRASICRDTDWGLAVETLRGPESIEFLLPSVQQTRSMARVLVLRNRLAVMEGRYEDALKQLRICYKLGQDVNELGFLVSSLVGVAEISMAAEGTLHLIAADNSPNLYWALAGLPQPIINLRRPMELEASIGIRYFNELDDVETAKHSPAEWKAILQSVVGRLSRLNALTSYRNPQGGTPGVPAEEMTVGLSLMSYENAKQRLVESGMASVEQMPVAQVVLIDAKRRIEFYSQEIEKAYCLPYSQFMKFSATTENRMQAEGRKNLGALIASMISPATQQVRAAGARAESLIYEMMIVESIRNHVSVHAQLPKSLDDLDLPAPMNPFTGKPYPCEFKRDKVVLKSEGFPSFEREYHIAFKK